MKVIQLLLAGVGFGVAAFAFRTKRSPRQGDVEEQYSEYDARLLGLKGYQTDVGGPTASHIRDGVGREISQASQGESAI